MKRVFASIVGAGVGVSFCVATVRVATALGADVSYPVYAGEEDLTFRVVMLLLVEWPGFALLGAWLGNVALRRPRQGLSGTVGVIAGTVVAFLVQAALIPAIRALPDSASANASVVVFLVGWIALSFVGAIIGVRIFGRTLKDPAPEDQDPAREESKRQGGLSRPDARAPTEGNPGTKRPVDAQ